MIRPTDRRLTEDSLLSSTVVSLVVLNDTSLELCFNGEVLFVCRFDEELDQLVNTLLGHHEVDGFSFDDILLTIDNK
jgi:hypothetical protein